MGDIAVASPAVQVVGLFKDRAVVVIGSQRSVLRVNGEAVAGVRLLAADSESAILEVDGVEGVYFPESRVHNLLGEPADIEVRINRNLDGLYQTTGSINGLLFSVLVDTGATRVALSEQHARRLGIDYRITGTPSRVETASGYRDVYRVNLHSIRIGDLVLRDVGAVVLPGNFPDRVLLGMSFLQRVEMENQGDRLVLRKRY